MEDVFCYEHDAVAPALFLDKGMMRKTNKAELMNAQMTLTPCIVAKYPDKSFHIVDECAWFYHIL